MIIYKMKDVFKSKFYFLQEKTTNPPSHDKRKMKMFEFDFFGYETVHDMCAFPNIDR